MPEKKLQEKFFEEIKGCTSVKEIHDIAEAKKEEYQLSEQILNIISGGYSFYRMYGMNNVDSMIQKIQVQIEKAYET